MPKIIRCRSKLNEITLDVEDLSRVVIRDQNFCRAILDREIIVGSIFRYCDFENAYMNSIRCEKTVFYGCSFIDADIRDAELTDCFFVNCFASFAIFNGAKMNNTVFYGLDLNNAQFIGSDFSNADLRGVDLAHSYLDKTKYNRDTKWMKGFDPEQRGCILLDSPDHN